MDLKLFRSYPAKAHKVNINMSVIVTINIYGCNDSGSRLIVVDDGGCLVKC